jgi:hypothetical protein
VIIATSLRKKLPKFVTDIKTISHAIAGDNGTSERFRDPTPLMCDGLVVKC